MSRRTFVFGAVVLVALIALATAVVPSLIHHQILGLGATDIYDQSTLPDQISVCGRDWRKDALDRQFSMAQAAAMLANGFRPALVDPGPFAPCPPGPCTRDARNSPCATAVFVRVGEDAYIDYELQGGP